ncbi:MAG: isoprenoid biosynthesis protein ElbB [Pseudomonadales bacterium]|jgi:enhancing lycopene biosynthesis protein 2|uniref:isoprenoid biosynthesis glyoxalase ElbB n=1 Tax=unclassified Ketobacter TaxID=2639109 RepID=UPI000C62150C|nr:MULTISPECIES: isoprenoid biosynthesis glyoxalase ElbB [unclassified Ketobacter]MAQ25489.1 isoprenoid biosynthesis protein ElbB [Pseudomonadales bacterium]MEC8813296.1 isoprenoid biosynthesis glyoxalase ElbB [Pseudomonadota bacterium]TNC89228.1 MAG: isoprenoid biosynthesis protein ElbB [Alcanivorax sp.]HAG96406.1 isoprenoid biosynthesis protein ElbB [Gammaproteobacteria bacterium]MBI27360.1 isoprenoid biosynthesis protein ElbB [Pseudomonadales bacterium]|tara:strand:+ start:16627 stop:17283 length:657 start_codon:yes stop_codon:yes gene_type:complete
MAKKVAVILAGCGVFDGAEIYEATLVQLRLDEAGAEFQCMAPNVDQMHVLNHMTGEEMQETRNVLVEASRLCRGEIIDLADANPDDYDAVIVPGGFGVAKNLSSFAVDGPGMSVNEAFLKFVQALHKQGKPVGLVCIAPALAPKLFGDGVRCTLGSNDDDAAKAVVAMGGAHEQCAVDEISIDEERNLVTTPAYMLAGRISEASAGISKLVEAVLARA